MLKTGVDLIEIERIKDSIDKFGERFLKRIYTSRELSLFGANVGSLAARWAAKEAVAKALGCGIGPVEWTEIEILHGNNKEPVLFLHEKAAKLAEEQGLKEWSLSLSHTHEHAIAFVAAIGE
jgi:holo-[acyl-carrier protein] synthase